MGQKRVGIGRLSEEFLAILSTNWPDFHAQLWRIFWPTLDVPGPGDATFLLPGSSGPGQD